MNIKHVAIARYGIQGVAMLIILRNVLVTVEHPIPFGVVFLGILQLVFLGISLTRAPKNMTTNPVIWGVGFITAIFPLIEPVFFGKFTPVPVALMAFTSVLQIVGLVIGIAAVLSLRGCLSQLPEAKQLVHGGIYRYIRHPMYTGSIVMLIGTWMEIGTVMFLFTVLIYAILLCVLAVAEERILESEFVEYESYKAKVGMFFPKVRFEN